MIKKENEHLNNIQPTRTNRHNPTLAECVCKTLSKWDMWQAMKQTDNLKLNQQSIFSNHSRKN